MIKVAFVVWSVRFRIELKSLFESRLSNRKTSVVRLHFWVVGTFV